MTGPSANETGGGWECGCCICYEVPQDSLLSHAACCVADKGTSEWRLRCI